MDRTKYFYSGYFSYSGKFPPIFTLKSFLFLCLIWNCSEGSYRCTLKNFIRLGNSCYFLSAEIASWQEAHFRCRDRGAQLAVLASHYEDTTLRNYLTRPEFAQLGRWIGGMWASKWIWAAQGVDIENSDSFADQEMFNIKDTDQWMCLCMDPNNKFRWVNENCMQQQHYICEAPLAKVSDNAAQDDSSTNAKKVSPDYNATTVSASGDNSFYANGTEAEADDANTDLASSTVEEINLSLTPAPE